MKERNPEAGQTITEYALLLAVVAVLALAIAGGLQGKFKDFAQALVSRVAQPCANCKEKSIFPNE